MPEHPFYVEGEGWVHAEDLQPGDDIRQADGTTGEVEAIEIEQTSQAMYNLTVDEAHSFFVGDGQWLVHNCPPPGGGKNSFLRTGPVIPDLIRDLTKWVQKVRC
jgi:intein/homing endonuclease